jgi:hypothetical protein
MSLTQPLLDVFLRLISGGNAFSPDRVLWVADAWPASANPLLYFTTPQAAMAQAAAIAPTPASPVLVLVAPGTYGGAPIVHVSDVYGAGLGNDSAAVMIPGVTWNPGAGVNLAKAAADESAGWANVTITGAVTIVATAKTGGFSRMDLTTVRRGVAPTTHTGRGNPLDVLAMADVDHSGAPIVLSGSQLDADSATVTADITAGGASLVILGSTQVLGDLVFNGTSAGELRAVRNAAPGNLTNNGTGTVRSIGSVHTGVVTQANAGGSIDVRRSTYSSLVGPGPINRDVEIIDFSTLGPGPQIVPIFPPFIDGDYGVAIVNDLNPGYLPLQVPNGSKIPTSFLVVDSLGGNDFTATLSHR